MADNENIGFAFSEKPLVLKEMTRRLNCFFSREMSYTVISQWLTEIGAIEKVTVNEHRTRKEPTEKGKQIGLSLAQRRSSRGIFLSLVFNADAQRFVMEHMDEIDEVAARKGKVSQEMIVEEMKRTEQGIRRALSRR